MRSTINIFSTVAQRIYVVTIEQLASVYTHRNLFWVGLEVGCFLRLAQNVRFILNMTIKIDKNDDVIQFLRTSSEFSRPENNV